MPDGLIPSTPLFGNIADDLKLIQTIMKVLKREPKAGFPGIRTENVRFDEVSHVVWRLADLLLSIWLVSDVSL